MTDEQAGAISDTRIYEGDLEARPQGAGQPDDAGLGSLDFLEAVEERTGQTDNPDEAAEEGLTWVPPVDPPTSGTEPDGDPRIAAGFGTSATDEPFDADHHGDALPADDEVTARVREAILADAATTAYADTLSLETAGSLVRVSGTVADLDDETAVLAVIADVEGITDVDNRLTVEGIG